MLQNATPLRKSPPGPPNTSDEDVSCTAPATEHASLQILFKCPTPAIVCWKCHKTLTFCSLLRGCMHNPLRLPCENTSEPPKVARTYGVLYMLTSKCASRHNGVHFFNISSSKSAPTLVCFVRFYFDMCFAPQLRAIFRHRNFQKYSEAGVLCAF